MDPVPFQPYQNPQYQPQAAWGNSNTYAPWSVPNGAQGNANPSFSGYGQSTSLGANPFDLGQAGNFAMNWGPWDFKGGSKRSSPNFYAPSYQGNWFMPQEGMPQFYGTSQQGAASDASLQAMMQPRAQNQAQSASQSGTANGASGLQDYSMPSYIGQTPWLGNTVGNYAPQIGSNYGGYGSYGGYGNSQGSGQASAYQPYVPTGGLGQY